MFDYSTPDKSLYIQKKYRITDKEYNLLHEKFGKLCWFAASKLTASNRRSDEDLQDYHSEIVLGMFRAGSYYKRQVFIENVFDYLRSCKKYMCADDIDMLAGFQNKWKKKSEFLETDENELVLFLERFKIYNDDINRSGPCYPNQNSQLKIDNKFKVYCKAIIWNTTKSLGQHISKENETKMKEVSLDEWSFLEGGDLNTVLEDNIGYNRSFYKNDFNVVRDKLSQLEDKRPLKTFDIIINPNNHESVFKQVPGKKEEIKINVVRKQTKMSYRTINKQLKIIKKIIEEQIGR